MRALFPGSRNQQTRTCTKRDADGQLAECKADGTADCGPGGNEQTVLLVHGLPVLVSGCDEYRSRFRYYRRPNQDMRASLRYNSLAWIGMHSD